MFGQRPVPARERSFIYRCPQQIMKFQQILLVDDNENDVELTLTALSQHNLASRIVVARDGLEALDHLNAQKANPEELPAVIFLDQKMPKLNGIDVLRQIRSDPALTL